MADEATIRTALQIKVGNLTYVSQPSAFTADVSVANGPTPGVVTCSTNGTDITLSQLASPGLCRIMNIDDTNYVDVGIWSADQSEFLPFMRVLAGESYVIRLSPAINQEWAGTGTGTTAGVNTLRIKANTAACNVLVEAFDS